MNQNWMNNQGLSFTADESTLILDMLKQNMSAAEIKKMEICFLHKNKR